MASASPSHLRAVPHAEDPRASPAELHADLLERARAGDVAAWSQLYEHLQGDVFRQIRYLAGCAVIAEELTQETFAQAMACRKRYDPNRPFGAWLHGIASNVVRKHWRKQRNKSVAHERFEHASQLAAGGSEGEPHDAYLVRERSRALYSVLEELPANLREAFILREVQGLSTAEAAERLKISPDNLAVRISRARAKLRDALIRKGWLERGDAGGS